MRLTHLIAIVVLGSAIAAPGKVFAQAAEPASPPQTPVAATGEEGTKPTRSFFPALGHNLVDDIKHLPAWGTVAWLAAGGAGALAVHPEDSEINGRLADADAKYSLFGPGKIIGSTYFILGGAAATYLVGRTIGATRAQHLGMDLIESALITDGVVQVMKISVRRQRPTPTDGSRTRTFSFPSGHAALTFAAATVLQQHLGYRAGIPTYLVASYVAMSRLHDNRHYASDVIFGAATGLVIGRAVTWHGRNFYASPMLVPSGAGILIASR